MSYWNYENLYLSFTKYVKRPKILMDIKIHGMHRQGRGFSWATISRIPRISELPTSEARENCRCSQMLQKRDH